MLCGDARVAAEAAGAVWTLQDRTISGAIRGEGIDNDLFDPVGVVTGTTAVSVPFAGSGPRPVPRVLSVLCMVRHGASP